VLLSYSYGSITAASFSTLVAVALVAFVYLTGITSVPGGIFGGIIYTGGIFAYALLDFFNLQGNWLNLFVGFLVVLGLISRPEGGATFLFYGKRPSLFARTPKRSRAGQPPGGQDGAVAASGKSGLAPAEVTS
jgi:hypothetical protein